MLSTTRCYRMLALASAVVLATGAGSAIAQTTLERIKQTGTMTSANTFTYPPFGYIESGQPVGLDVDLGQEIARRMGVKLTFEKVEFKGIIAALTSKRVDTLITALTWTPERAQRVLFSEPYFDGGIGAAYRSEMPITKPDEVPGKRVGLELGSAGERWTRDKFGQGLANVKTYDTLLLALKDLESGRTDVVVSSLPAVRFAIRTMPTIRVSEVWDSRIVGINTRKEDADLLAEINKHLIAMKSDGTYDKLVAKWFGK